MKFNDYLKNELKDNEFAKEYESLEPVKQLNDEIEKLNLYSSIALVNAISARDMKAVKAAIADGANINISHGAPLRRAAMKGDIEMAAYLIEQGADTDDILEDIVSCAYDYDGTSGELEKELLKADKKIYANITKAIELTQRRTNHAESNDIYRF